MCHGTDPNIQRTHTCQYRAGINDVVLRRATFVTTLYRVDMVEVGTGLVCLSGPLHLLKHPQNEGCCVLLSNIIVFHTPERRVRSAGS